jgi:4-hydroxybenzoate polyprenyltransferase
MRISGEAMNHTIRSYLILLRPFTLLAPLIVSSSVMLASLIHSNSSTLSISSLALTILTASFCFALLNGASNVLNQATDRKEDALSKPYRPIPQKLVAPKQAYAFSIFLYLIALVLSLTIHSLFCFFVCIVAFFSVTYSCTLRMKKFLLLNQLWVALPRGFFGIVGSWSVFGNPFEPLPLAMGSVAALFLFGGTATKDILDAEADKTVGTRTLVNVFGLKTAALFSLVIMTSAFCLILPLVYFGIIKTTLLPLAALSILSIIIGWLMFHHHKNTTCENTSAWTLMYTTYFIFALSFSAITISFSA